MKWIIKLGQKKYIFLLLLSSFLLPITIIHILFKVPAISTFFIAEWSAGDFISYTATFMAFLGTVALGGLALFQNDRLNKINRDITQHQYKPLITVSHSIDEKDEKEKLRTFYRTVEKNVDGILINSGWSQQKTIYPYAKLSFINIGLGPAVHVQLFWYQLNSVKGILNLNEIKENNIEDFYDKVDYSNFEFTEHGTIKNEQWMIYTESELGVSEETNRLNLLFSFEKNVDPFHSIIEIRYENLMGRKFKKLLYLGFVEEPTMLPISKEY